MGIVTSLEEADHDQLAALSQCGRPELDGGFGADEVDGRGSTAGRFDEGFGGARFRRIYCLNGVLQCRRPFGRGRFRRRSALGR